jgi:hypothetical protein
VIQGEFERELRWFIRELRECVKVGKVRSEDVETVLRAWDESVGPGLAVAAVAEKKALA